MIDDLDNDSELAGGRTLIDQNDPTDLNESLESGGLLICLGVRLARMNTVIEFAWKGKMGTESQSDRGRGGEKDGELSEFPADPARCTAQAKLCSSQAPLESRLDANIPRLPGADSS